MSVVSLKDRRTVRFWRPDSSSVTGMIRVEREDRTRTIYAEHFSVVVVYEGAFDGWNRSGVRTHVAGGIKLTEPGEVHRDVRVHAPFTLQAAGIAREAIAAAATALGLRGPAHFRTPGLHAGERAALLAFAMHAALEGEEATELERETLVVETLSQLLSASPPSSAMRRGARAPRAVRRARAFLHDALAEKVTLDALAEHAGLDKFHLVRAFHAEVGLPPYEYLTHLRISKAKGLLERGVLVAEAAQTVGFYDESQLYRHFRRIVGITPGRFSRSFTTTLPTRQHRPSDARGAAAHSAHEPTPSHGRLRSRSPNHPTR
jgi:AraC-like DNA-binding protein